MPYIGNVPAEAYSQVSYQDLTGGSGTSFTLDYPVGSAGEIEVFVNNVRQEPTVAYTVSGTSLTMTGSIAATDDFYVVFQGKAQQTIGIPEKQTDGTYLFGDSVTIDADGSTVLTVDRATSDGTIIDVQKSGTTVGSIGTTGGDFYLTKSGSNQTGIYFNELGMLPMTSGSISDNSRDIGQATYRWQDLYLSGGVYLGGTGSANYLDDYEEGTFTPGLKGASSGNVCALANAYGNYTKIGKIVTVNLNISISSTNGAVGNMQITGLPFTVATVLPATGLEASGVSTYWNGWSTAINGVYLGAEENSTICYVYGLTGSSATGASGYTVAQIGTGQMRGTITYRST